MEIPPPPPLQKQTLSRFMFEAEFLNVEPTIIWCNIYLKKPLKVELSTLDSLFTTSLDSLFCFSSV